MLKKSKLKALVISAAVSITMVAASMTTVFAAGEQYVSNGGFEQHGDADISQWGLFCGWENMPGVIQSDVVHSGSIAARIQQLEVEAYLAQASGWADQSVVVPYDGTKPAYLSVWVKYENVDDGGFFLRCERKYVTDMGEQTLEVYSDTYTGSSDGWVQVTLEVPADPDNHTFKEVLVGIMVKPGTGVVYVDDMSFGPDAPSAASIEVPDTAEETAEDTTENTAAPETTTTAEPSKVIPGTGDNTANIAVPVAVIALGGIVVFANRRKNARNF